MEVRDFISRYKEAFSERAELPVAVWYADEEQGMRATTKGCMLKAMSDARGGQAICFDCKGIGCTGGRYKCGFTGPGRFLPRFLSEVEKYKDTPEAVEKWLALNAVVAAEKKYLCFARIDQVETFEGKEGLVFFANPDILSGLCDWAFYDNGDPSAVVVMFDSGCGQMVSQMVGENRRGGRRVFLGLTDISARQFFEPGIMSLSVPMSRINEMYVTMERCFLLGGNRDWDAIKGRIGS